MCTIELIREGGQDPQRGLVGGEALLDARQLLRPVSP
jgi:hypothetical protein